MIYSFVNLRSDELALLAPEITVFIFSLGGLEQHGPHLPMGTKWFIAEKTSQLLIENLQLKMPQWNFVFMPTLPLTADTITSKVAFPVRAHVVRDYLVDQAEGLKRLGFSRFIVYSSHLAPRQLTAIEDAAKIISRKKSFFSGHKSQCLSVSSIEVRSSDVFKSPMIANPIEHGGANETALMLSWQPKLVSKEFQSLADVARPQENISRWISYFKHHFDGYWGKPREAASMTVAAAVMSDLNQAVEKTAVMLKAVFETGQGEGLYKSGYRYFFFNGSFFKAYLFASIFFVMMVIWTLWSLKDLFEQ